MNGNALTSFMDLIACGLGAAILLFLVGASVQRGVADDTQDEMILVRCEIIGGAAAAIGIEYLSPASPSWHLAETDLPLEQGVVLGTSSREDERTISFALFFGPEKGKWIFRPVFLDYAGTRQTGPTRIRLSVTGKNIRTVEEHPDSLLTHVGESGETTQIEVYQGF